MRPWRYSASSRSSKMRCRRMSRNSANRSSALTAAVSAHGSIGMTALLASVAEQLVEGVDGRVDGGHVRILELGREGHRRVGRRVQRGWGVEVLERPARDEREDH